MPLGFLLSQISQEVCDLPLGVFSVVVISEQHIQAAVSRELLYAPDIAIGRIQGSGDATVTATVGAEFFGQACLLRELFTDQVVKPIPGQWVSKVSAI